MILQKIGIVGSVLVLLCMATFTSHAVETESNTNEPERVLLRQLLADIQEGINKQDFEKIKAHLHQDVIVTFQNAELTKGISGVEKYMKEVFEGANAVLKSFSTNAKVDQPAIFYGNTAVAAGYTTEKYNFTDGLGFELYTRWSAALLKDGDQWKVIELHFSNNLFDNPLLSQANQSNILYAAGGAIIGIILMFVVGRITRKKVNA